MYYLKNITYLLFLLLLLNTACSEEDDPAPVGQPPTAVAGGDLQATVNSSVPLDGSGSSDPDGGALTYSWELTTRPDGSTTSVVSPAQATTTFVPDLPGNYVATLTVTDADNNNASDAVTIEVSEAVGNPPVALITDENGRPISEDNGNNGVTVTSPYELDGSGSSDPDQDNLTYAWTIATKPEGSERATISGDDQDEAVFTPDVVGEYVIRLTVSDPDGNTNAADVTLMANASPVIVSGTISADTVWKDIFADPTVPDYLVVGNLTAAAELTLAPGVVVHLDEDVVFTVDENGGVLIAEGTADKGIILTSSDVAGEVRWGGLLVNSSSSNNVLNYTTVSYAGGIDQLIYQGGYRKAGIAISADGRLKITNSTVSHHGGDGMFTLGSASLAQFENNAFADNENYALSISINQAGVIDDATTFTDNSDTDKRENVVRIYDSSLSNDQTWTALSDDASYVMVGNVTLSAELTVSPGARLEFGEDVRMEVASGGALIADGTADNKIIFTTTSPESDQYWGGLLIESSSTKNVLNYAEISYAGGEDQLIYYQGYRKASLALANESNIAVTNTEFIRGEGHGIFASPAGGITAFSGNTFNNITGYPLYVPMNLVGMVDANTTITDNNDNVVAVYASTLTSDASFSDPASPQWVALAENAQYLATGKLTVSDDLVLAEGAYLAFAELVTMEVTTTGSLKAVGSTANPVTLTAYEQTGSDNWGGLLIESDDSNELRYAEVSYAGKEDQLIYIGGYRAANIAVSADGSLDLYDTTVANSDDHGLVVASGGTVNGLSGGDADPATAVRDANSFSDNENASEIIFF